MHEFFQAFTDKANLVGAAAVAGLASLLGPFWPVFPFFFALNCVDFYYGRRKAVKTGTLSSSKGADGIRKKVSYWVVIALAFGAGFVLKECFGAALGVDLSFLLLLGWFTLGVYVLNELTSIVENLLVLGYDVPEIFIRGLAAAKSAVDEAGNKVIPKEEQTDGE